MRFLNFLCLLFFGFLINFKFLFSRFPTKCKMGISMIFFFFWNLSVHIFLRNGRKWEIEENWISKKWRAVEIACFRGDVCVLNRSVHLLLHILSCFRRLFLLGCPSFSGFCFLCACCRRAGVLRWFLSVVGSPTLSGSAEALPPPAEKLRDVLLPSLPSTKKTLLK